MMRKASEEEVERAVSGASKMVGGQEGRRMREEAWTGGRGGGGDRRRPQEWCANEGEQAMGLTCRDRRPGSACKEEGVS